MLCSQLPTCRLGWAAHADRREMMDFLSGYSRNVWTLTFRGYVDRMRALLREEPGLARQVESDGDTPLWWLPDDDAKAMEMVELLLAAVDKTQGRKLDSATAGKTEEYFRTRDLR